MQNFNQNGIATAHKSCTFNYYCYIRAVKILKNSNWTKEQKFNFIVNLFPK